MQPYLKYAYTVSKLALLFALLLALDYLLPTQQRTDKVTYVTKVFSDKAGSLRHEHTQLKTWSGRNIKVSKEAGYYFEQHQDLFLYSTPILGKARYVAPVDKQESAVLIEGSIYGNFIFFPLILLVCALLGSLKRFNPEVDFSFGVVSGILSLISLGLLIV